MRNKRCVGACILTTLLLFASCAGARAPSSQAAVSSSQEYLQSTDTWSTAFTGQQGKIDFLTTYVACPTAVLDAKYHIVFQNHSGGGEGRITVPGPSDWDMMVAVRVHPQDVAAWAQGMEEIALDDANLAAWDALPLEGEDWNVTSTPTEYKRPDANSWVVVYAPEGVVFKYFTTYGAQQPTAFL